MSGLWKFCRKNSGGDAAAKRLFLFLNTLLWGLAGFSVWLILRYWVLNSTEWAVAFAGIPAALAGWFGGIVYLYRV